MTIYGWLVLLGIILLSLLCLLPDYIYYIKHKGESHDFYDDEDTYIG